MIKSIPGTRWAAKPKAYREPKSALCAVCDGPRATTECPDCGEFIHKSCREKHQSFHLDEIMETYNV